MITMRSRSAAPPAVAVATLAALVALAGCSFSTGSSPGEAALELIEGPLGEQNGLVYRDAECAEPAADAVGDTFACTATTDDGAAVEFTGVVDADDKIFVAPTNVIVADEMPIVEAEAAQVLGEVIGAEIDPSAVECPDVTTVLVDGRLRCEITDESNGDRYEMFLTATDFVLREGFDSRNYEVGELID